MVQREIKRKTRIYAVSAIFLASIAIATIYTISSPTLLYTSANISPMKTFTSTEEMKNFIAANTKPDSSTVFSGGLLDSQYRGLESNGYSAQISGAQSGATDLSYSTTNIQVSGVDEADIAKTDGSYIYTLASDSYALKNNLYIVNADPQDAKIVSVIRLGNNTYAAGLFVSQDSNRLVILGSQYNTQIYVPATSNVQDYSGSDYFYSSVKTFIYIYDISNKNTPSLVRNYTLSGSYFNSRMIGDYVYTVISEPAYVTDNNVSLPKVYDNTVSSEISPTNIYYADTAEDNYFTYTTLVALNVKDNSQEPSTLTVLMGSTCGMYVSQTNLYVTCPTNDWQITAVYRISINGATMSFQAKGAIPGYILNQYSMDEYQGYFRVATTTSTGSWVSSNQENNIYILNADLTVVGKIENIASGERIYAARFMGEKGYLVTFKQTDPFFILDLSNPTAPVIAGELKIPGYSSYLHPYDENHVIGVGKENNTLKISLFDVTNLNNPILMTTFIVNASYSDSQALYDPKAFLFDYTKNLLVLPVSGYNQGFYDSTGNSGTVGVTVNSYWQGAYVFKLSSKDGFVSKGIVTHLDNNSSTYYYTNYNQIVNRALYIGNTLYTISNTKVQLNNLDTLSLIATVKLQ